jgi:hypothetical protein
MMKMRKVGTVVQSNSGQAKGANPRKQRAGGMTCYTLCVIYGAAKRNSSQYGCGFDILGISGLAPASLRAVRMPCPI